MTTIKAVGLLVVGLLVGAAGVAIAQEYATDETCAEWLGVSDSWRAGYVFGALSVLDASPLMPARDTANVTVGQMQRVAESWCRLYPAMNVARLMLWVTGYAISPPSTY